MASRKKEPDDERHVIQRPGAVGTDAGMRRSGQKTAAHRERKGKSGK